MGFFYDAGFAVVVLAAVVYIGKAWNEAWNEAKRRRDGDFATRPGAGLSPNERKPSALPYLFR